MSDIISSGRRLFRPAVFESYLYADEQVLEALERSKTLTPAKRRLEENRVDFDAQLSRKLAPATRKTLFGWIRPFTVKDDAFSGSLTVTDEAFNNRTYRNVARSESYPKGIPCYVNSHMLVLGSRVAEDYFKIETCIETSYPAEPGQTQDLFAKAIAGAENATLGVARMQALIKQIRATESL